MRQRRDLGILHRLAHSYGVQTSYYDVNQVRQSVKPEPLLAVLGAMGAPVHRVEDARDALREHRHAMWSRPIEPVAVAWDGGPMSLDLRLPAQMSDAPVLGHLHMEDGRRERLEWRGSQLPTMQSEDVDGRRYVSKRLSLPGVLPLGYHRMELEVLGRAAESLIISAPTRAFSPMFTRNGSGMPWGVFLPLYALRSDHSAGVGDFTDLETLTEWVAGLGGSVVATLPLLPSFLDEPYDPSPYSPITRLMWSEMYLDLERIPEMDTCVPAREVLGSQEVHEEFTALKAAPLVDYRRQMALKRRVLEALCRCCLQDPNRREQLRRFAHYQPQVEDYAAFRATCERKDALWRQWEEPQHSGTIGPGDYDEEVKDYHIYVQWMAQQQMEHLSQRPEETGLGLYLDLPLGVHPDGYDTWRYQGVFAHGTRAGAPPDAFFSLGQDWGFPPVDPASIREQGYGYYIEVFRNHLHHAGVMRIDHVMGLHRLYWVPEGHDPTEGAYVRYAAEELYAILAVESHREQCWLVGENLGTVLSYVNTALSRHGLGGMYVLQFETNTDSHKALNPVPSNTVASIGTHDMPPFASYWHGEDIDRRLEMGLLNNSQARQERTRLRKTREALVRFLKDRGYLQGEATPEAVHAACVAYLGRSSARLVLVNLEDLWQEREPQNVPSTGQERPNWRRKARYSFEEFSQMPAVVDVLREVNRSRR